MDYAADILAKAIEQHRDSKAADGQVFDANDIALYDTHSWWETWKDHAPNDNPYAPILED